jgi:hypothetical protein
MSDNEHYVKREVLGQASAFFWGCFEPRTCSLTAPLGRMCELLSDPRGS